MKKHCSFIFILISFITVYSQQAGDLDTGFGNQGIVKTNLWNASHNVKSHAVLSDGKTIVAGEIDNGYNPKGFVMRLLANGNIDTSFGDQGKVVHPFINGINIVKIQADGKILVGSSYNNDIAIARYLANGTLDTGFAFDGTYYNTTAEEDSFPSHEVIDMEIQADNKIVGLTTSFIANANKFRLFRLNANGILDTTLNVNDNFGTSDFPIALSIQSDGKFIVNGYYYNGSTPTLFIARYTTSGLADTTFNTTGRRAFSISNTTAVNVTDLLLQADGKILMSGKYFSNGTSLFVLRMNSNGAFDTTFSSDGFQGAGINVQFGSKGSIALQSDGKIIQMDSFYNGTTENEDMLLVRYTANGDLDNTFFNGGSGFTLSFNALNDKVSYMSISNNKLFISGNSETSIVENNLVFGRYNLNTFTADTTFGTNGLKQQSLSHPTYEEVIKSVVQSDNKTIVLTKVYINNLFFNGLQRFNENGTLDTTFGSNGKVALGFFFTEFEGLAVDNASNILISGYQSLGSGVIVRITPAGALDATFGDQGITYLEESLDFIPRMHAIAIQSNNKIVIGGGNNVNGIIDYLLVRLNANGTIDNTFGDNGISMVGLTNVSEIINDIEVLSDGKILAIGRTNENFANDFQAVILKFNSVGLLDPSFNGTGKYFTERAVDFFMKGDIEVQTNGKILTTFEALSDDFILYRLNANGTLDTTFGSGGFTSTFINGNDFSTQLHYNPVNQNITLVGTTVEIETGKFALTRYNTNGILDSTFGDNGVVITDIGSTSQVISAAPTNNGKLVVSGWLYNQLTDDYDQVLAKYYLEEALNISTPEDNLLAVYPSPAKEILYFKLPEQTTVKTYTLTDMSGKLIEKGNVSIQNGINLSNLSSGMYLIQLDSFTPVRFIKE
jgi:uncharacterized delta-60 repeat protein